MAARRPAASVVHAAASQHLNDFAGFTPQTWAATVLHRLGIHQTPGAVQALTGWARAEGGHWNNDAKYNPLNTTQPAPGAGNTGTQGNIKVYKSWDQGINATVQTLRNGRYGGILSALQAGDPGAVASAIGNSPWGTSAAGARAAIMGTPQVAGVHAVDAGSGSASPSASSSHVELGQKSVFDAAGFEQARKRSVLANLLSQQPGGTQNNPLFASGLLSMTAPNRQDFTSMQQTSKTVTDGATPASGGSGSAAADFAKARVGRYQENLGANQGTDLNVLENRFGMRGQPWCAIFATTAAAHGGASRAVRTASVAQINQWAAEGSHGYAGLLDGAHAQKGDLMTFGNAHVGLVTGRTQDGRVITIEGNTSTGGVQQRVHAATDGKVARPHY